MVVKTYGKIYFQDGQIYVNEAQPHICIKLKALFKKIAVGQSQPFKFKNTPENCNDLLWFMERYPLEMSSKDTAAFKRQKKVHKNTMNALEAILLPDYKPATAILNEGKAARNYQLTGRDIFLSRKRLLNGDDIGLGKTLTAILACLDTKLLPAAVVVQTHMPKQWKEAIEEFTSLRVHIIKKTQPYNLPDADIYLFKYSQLAGWSNFYETGFFNTSIFDEAQELRHNGTGKYNGAVSLSNNTEYVQGLTATPIYNFGDEIYNVLNVINPGCLGSFDEFSREWCGYGRVVTNPQALGTYLRENFLMLRRTRKEVGRELPPINKIVHMVGYDEDEVKKSEEIAHQLAIKVTSGSFMERGKAAMELDILVRKATGVSKAREVANFVRILLENNEPIVLAAWHRDVYDILLSELADFKPVMYTGTESPAQKESAKQAFISGDTNLFIISLRSGIGLDGLQHRSNMIVLAELDWSPKVHDQLIGRLDRDGQQEQVTAIYLVSEYGSDPLIIDLLGLKSSQSHNILNPLTAIEQQHADDSRLKLLAQKFLKKSDLVPQEDNM